MPLFILAHLSHHILSALLTPLLPYIRDHFALTYTQAGWLISAFNLSYGAGQLPAGWLADRIGPRIVLTIGIAGVGLTGFLVGMAPTYIVMIVFLVLLGVTGGGYHPAAAPLLSASTSPKNQGRILGLHQIGGSASFFLAPLIAAGLAVALGWRGTFFAISIPTLIFGIVFYLLLGRLGYTRKVKPKTATGQIDAKPVPGHSRRLAALLTISIAVGSLTYAAVQFIPLLMVDTFGLSEGAAAATLALVFSGGLWAGPLGGYLSDRVGSVPVIVAAGIIVGPVVYLTGIVPYDWSFSVLLVLMGMAVFATLPVSEAYVVNNTTESNRSTVLGIYYFGSRGGPGALAPVVGYLSDHFGFSTAFGFVGAAIFTVTVICAIYLWVSRR